MLVDIVKNPYAWPGGYERVMILNDGACLCSTCCRKAASCIMDDIRDGYDTGWLPACLSYEATTPATVRFALGETGDEYITQCAHCYKDIGELSG
jgi:hypothetical protein